MKCSLSISNFLEEVSSLFHAIVFLISLHWSPRKAFVSLLAILWNSAFRWLYLSFSPLPFAFLLFSAICKASPDSHFAFCKIRMYYSNSCNISRWGRVDLQCCVSFCCAAQGIRDTCTSSHSFRFPPRLRHRRAVSEVPCAAQQVLARHLLYMRHHYCVYVHSNTVYFLKMENREKATVSVYIIYAKRKHAELLQSLFLKLVTRCSW